MPFVERARFRRRRRAWPVLAMIGLGFVGAACAYRGQIDNPLTLKATWFSYLEGGDIRQSCAPGAVDRYRLVYNARYTEQLRSYEVTADGTGGGVLVARALGGANLLEIRLDDPQAPWRWQKSEARLAPGEMTEFVADLDRAGLFGPPPDGLRLNSWQFYWAVSACRDGRFYFSAWAHPGPQFDSFEPVAEFLFARDKTGLPVSRPRPVDAAERFGSRGGQEERGATTRFTLQVEGNGLGGITAID